MATNALRLVNGIPRMQTITAVASLPAIYEERLSVVSGVPANSNEIQGPVTTGTLVTLPNSGTYSSEELEIFLNGERLEDGFDYNFEGTVPRTQVSFTFGLVVGDNIDFRKERDL